MKWNNLDVLEDASEIIHYNQPGIPIYIVESDLKHFPDKRALCHWHDDIEILYVSNGHMDYNVNGNVITLNEGDAVIVNAKQLHYGFSADGSDCIYYCLVFKPEVLFHNDILYERYVSPIVMAQEIPCTLLLSKKPQDRKILALIPEIYRLQARKELVYELKIISLLQKFWSLWYQLLQPEFCIVNDQIDQNITIQKQMVLFIHKNYAQKLQIEDIAEAGNVCRTKCCQIFKKYFHSSPIEYLNTYRLEKACGLLAKSNDSGTITEIALACGFNSSSYFAEIFRKKKGCSPREYKGYYVEKYPSL